MVINICFLLQSSTIERHLLTQGFYLHDRLRKLRRLLTCDSLFEGIGRIVVALRG